MAEIFKKELKKEDIKNIKKRLAIPTTHEVLAAFGEARDVKVRDDQTDQIYTFKYGSSNTGPVFGGNWHVFARTKNFNDGDTIVLYRADKSERESGAEYKIEIRSRD